ncbi:MAG: inorganic phosphate transporter [Gammaproteobacteria bacterium]|nr:inorganic phosphate transporter [Gammaproteobacteria bacterium]
MSSGLILGWSLGANDAANVFGTAVGTRMVRFATAATVCSVFVILGAVVSGGGAAQTLGALGSVNALAGAFMVALSAAAVVYLMLKAGLPVSTSQAIVGAIIGWNLYSDSITDSETLVKIVVTWVACPVLAGLIAVPLLKLVGYVLGAVRLHLLRIDAYTRLALILAGAFGSYSLGANNIANVMGVFVDVSPFTQFAVGDLLTLTSVQQLFLLGGVAISIGVFTYSRKVMLTIGRDLLPLSPVSAWVVVTAHSIVLFLFASQGLEQWLTAHGLPALPLVPVSSTQAVVGAVVGLGLLRGGRDIDWRLLGNIGAGWVAAPVAAALVCFVALFFLQNVFNQQVYREVRYVVSSPALAQLAARGVPTAALANIEGQMFHSARAFMEGVRGAGLVEGKHDRVLRQYAEIGPYVLSADKLSRVDRVRMSPAQLDALERLEGRRFRHKWQLAEALAAITTEWAVAGDRASRQRDKQIERKLSYLYRVLVASPNGA